MVHTFFCALLPVDFFVGDAYNTNNLFYLLNFLYPFSFNSFFAVVLSYALFMRSGHERRRMRTFFHTKKTLACMLAVLLLAGCSLEAVMYTHTALAGNKQSLSDAVKSTVYRGIAGASGYLQTEDWTGACDMLLADIDEKCRDSSIELASDQKLKIRDTLQELMISLYDHGMITFDADGNLTELSKAYLSNAASYAVTSVAGAGEVAVSSTVLSDLVSTDAIDAAVDKVRSSYTQSVKELSGEEQGKTDLSDIRKQLNTLKKSQIAEETKFAELSRLALRVDALETMADTLKNSPVTVTAQAEDFSDSFADRDETTAKLAAVESGLDAMQAVIDSADTSGEDAAEKVDQLSTDVTILTRELADLKQSKLEDTFSSLNKEISAREAAVSSLKSELDTITQSSQSTAASFQNSISGLSSSLTSMQTSLNEVRSEQQGALNSWKTEVNGTITAMKQKLSVLSDAEEVNAASLTSLNHSIDDVKLAVNDQEQNLSDDISQLEKRLQAEINDTRQSLAEQLNSVKTQLFSRFEALDLSLSNAIDEETVERASSDAALQEQIHSTANTSLETKAEEVQGDSVFAKIGSLLKKITSLYTYVDNSVSSESSAREAQIQQLKTSFDGQVDRLNLAMQNLQNELSGTDSDNMAAIAAAKRELELALDDLHGSLTTDIRDLDTKTQADISAVLDTVQQLKESLKQSDSGMEENLEQAKEELGEQLYTAKEDLYREIFQVESSLNDAVAQERQALSEEVSARKAAEQQLRETIDTEVREVNLAIDNLERDLTDDLSAMDASHSDALAQTKSDLESALSQLQTTLSGEISALDQSSREQMDALRSTVSTLQTTLQNADAILASDLANTRTQLSSELTTARTQLSDQIRSLDSSLNSSINSEKQEREEADQSLLARIRSKANTLLEQQADEIDGSSIFEKLGALLKSFTSYSERTDQALSAESAERSSAVQKLQEELDANIENVDQSIRDLQTELRQADADNTQAIQAAKSNLEQALDTLNQSLSGNISALDTKTQGQIAEIRETVTTLRTDLEIADRNLSRDLTSAKSTLSGQISSAQTTLSGQISTLDHSLNQTVEAEAQAREEADSSLRDQIRSTSNTDLEKQAAEISGSTVFEKLGSLLGQISALKKTDEWAQNITLSHTASSGTKIYGILNSSDSAHAGWKVWKLDGASLGLTFCAEGDGKPESEIVITYAGNPVIIMEYQIKDGFLMIYTPSAPASDIIISSIHVQNQFVTP